jgi:hypothetical protein
MAEHQLNRADVHVLRQEATRALVTQDRVQVNLSQLGAIDTCTALPRFWRCARASAGDSSRFEISEPGKDFELYSEARLKRVR